MTKNSNQSKAEVKLKEVFMISKNKGASLNYCNPANICIFRLKLFEAKKLLLFSCFHFLCKGLLYLHIKNLKNKTKVVRWSQ